MKKIPALLLFLTTSLLSGFGLTDSDYRLLSRYQERPEGSVQEQLLKDYLAAFALRHQIAVKISPLNYLKQYHSFSSNIELFIPGESDNEIIYAIPLNNNNSSLLPLLLMIEQLTEAPQKPTISARFLFLGAEHGDNEFYPIGSNGFIDNYAPKADSAVFYFDFESPSSNIEIAMHGNHISPLWSMQQAVKIIKQSGLKPVLNAKLIDSMRSNLIKQQDSSDIFLQNGLSTVLLSTPANDGNQKALIPWAQNLANELVAYHQSLTSISHVQDYNYLVIGHYFISETVFLAIYLVLIFIIGLGLSSRHKIISIQTKRLASHLSEFTILFLSIFTFLFLSGLTVENIFYIKDDINFWRYIPLFFGLFKFVYAFFLTNLFFRILRTLIAHTNFVIYSSAAIFFGTVNLIGFTIWNLSYALPWLWFLISALIFYRSQQLWLSRFAFFSACVPLILLVSRFFSLAFQDVIEYFLFSHFLGNLILSLISFPALLLGVALFNRYSRAARSYQRSPWFSLSSLLVVSVASYAFLLVYQPYNRFSKEKQPLFLTQTEDLNLDISTVKLLSPANIKNVNLLLNNNSYPLYGLEKSAELRVTPTTTFSLTSITKKFLSRNQIQMSLESNKLVTQFYFTLVADQPIGIIDCNYPIMIRDPLTRPNEAEIFIGKNPPLPLKIDLVTEKELKFQLQVRAVINETAASADSRFDLHQTYTASETLNVNNDID